MSWQSGVLAGIGAPAYGTGLTALTLWAGSEGMPSWENNWLATSINGFGGTVINSTGVKAFPSVTEGVAATAATLLLPAYTAVVNAFRSQANMATIWQAVNASPWCGGCQTGHYPVQLWQAVLGQIPVTTIHITPPSAPAPGTGTPTQAWEQLRRFGDTKLPKLVQDIQTASTAALHA